MEPTPVISYASPSLGKPRVTFRGALVTLTGGLTLILISIGFIYAAWSIFEVTINPLRSGRDPFALEVLGTFVSVLAGISFIAGLVTFFVGLAGVRERRAM